MVWILFLIAFVLFCGMKIGEWLGIGDWAGLFVFLIILFILLCIIAAKWASSEKKEEDRQIDSLKKLLKVMGRDFGGTLADTDVMKLTGLSRNTYYKYKRELKAV